MDKPNVQSQGGKKMDNQWRLSPIPVLLDQTNISKEHWKLGDKGRRKGRLNVLNKLTGKEKWPMYKPSIGGG